MEIIMFVDPSGSGRLAYDLFLDGEATVEETVTRVRPWRYRSVWLPTATAFEMAGIIEAMMAANRLMETLTPHRLDGWILTVYNDNGYAAEYSYPNWHTAESVAANCADHLLPLAELAWALSTSLQSRGVIIRLCAHHVVDCLAEYDMSTVARML